MRKIMLAGLGLVVLVLAVLVAIAVWSSEAARGPNSVSVGSGGGTGVVASPGIPSTATDAVIEYVHDGDTLFLEDGRKVRLLGIDTPEIGEEAECWGDEATMLLRSMLPEGTAVSVVADVEPLDQYGRSLLFIYTDSTNVNLELVRLGAAEAVFYEPNDLLQSELRAAEGEARDAQLGRWGACG